MRRNASNCSALVCSSGSTRALWHGKQRRANPLAWDQPAALPTCSTLAALLCLTALTAQAEDYTYTTNNGAITITGYTGPGGDVTIPDTINGLPVTTIGGGAFKECTNLTSMTIPDGVSVIGGDWDTGGAFLVARA